jgi:hypothetical protein
MAKIEAFKNGFKFVEAPNDCLGTKMNIGIERALEYDFDYLMNLGSDDIITKDLFKAYEPYFKDKKPFFGSTRLTFLDSRSKEAKTFDYGVMIGAGRCIRRDVLESCAVVDGEVIMYDKIQAGLDMNSAKKFAKWSMIEIKNDYDTIYDIKSDVNIWAYDIMKGNNIDFGDAVSGLNTKQIDSILEL